MSLSLLDPRFREIEPWNMAELISRDLPKVACWIEPAVLPKGGKLLFGGHAKVGKSFVLLEMARSLATGKTPFDYGALSIAGPTCVLLIEQEIGPWGLQKRAQRIFADESMELLQKNFHGISQARGLRLDQPGVTDLIAEWCHKVEARVLFLDPIGKLHGYDENDASQINRLFGKLDEILEKCKELDLSVVFSHHFVKPNRDPRVQLEDEQLFSPYNFRGSTRWYDDPDTLITVNRLAPPNTLEWKWWMLKTRWETRQGGEIPEWASFSVNKYGDLRVRYEGDGSGKLSKLTVGL